MSAAQDPVPTPLFSKGCPNTSSLKPIFRPANIFLPTQHMVSQGRASPHIRPQQQTDRIPRSSTIVSPNPALGMSIVSGSLNHSGDETADSDERRLSLRRKNWRARSSER
jgi:hypothetical protein